MTTSGSLRVTFTNLYGAAPRIFRAPGRVNLIGEHTDYNEGFVMPAAIDASTWVAIAPREDRQLVIRSDNFSETAELDLDQLPAHGRRHWSDYPFGVAVELEQAGVRLRGANVLVRGEVPIGAGLSSSAAIEVASGLAFLANADQKMDLLPLARLCQKAENEFAGTRCGLMDQFTACFGENGRALLLDCRSLEYRTLPLPEDVKVVVCNTMVRHELAAGEYNARRADCEAGVRFFAQKDAAVGSLRDVSLAALEQASNLPPKVQKRCRHVITENARVTKAANALNSGDLTTFGQMMAASHASLRDDFEVSCAELDLMVSLANRIGGVFGARMTGGGFGGCTVNLVQREEVVEFKQRIAREYQSATDIVPEIYVCTAASGAERTE